VNWQLCVLSFIGRRSWTQSDLGQSISIGFLAILAIQNTLCVFNLVQWFARKDLGFLVFSC